MAQRIVIDPVTRIEGHLRIEVEVENGVVKDAFLVVDGNALFHDIDQGFPELAAAIGQELIGIDQPADRYYEAKGGDG